MSLKVFRCSGICPGKIALTLALVLLAVQSFGFGATAQDPAPAATIVSPTDGAQVTTDDILLEVKAENFTLDCPAVGRPDVDGHGHIHVMVDGMSMAQLINFYCEKTITIPGDGLAAGPHTIIVMLSSNTHMDMMETMTQVEIDFRGEREAAARRGRPGRPRGRTDEPDRRGDGAAGLHGRGQPGQLQAQRGPGRKQNVPGYGHWHVFVDTSMSMMGGMMDDAASPDAGVSMDMATPAGGMAMMSMAGMVAMPGSDSFELDLTAWGPGTHTIWIEPVQNDHTMFAEFGHIEFTVVVEG